ALASQHGLNRKEPLAACDRSLEVIEEFEVALAKFEHRDVARRPNPERSSVLEYWKSPRGIDRHAGHGVGNSHPVAEELRHAVGRIDDSCLPAVGIPTGGERIGPDAGLHDLLDGIPPD